MQEPKQSLKKTGRGLKILLVVSLGINLAIVGLVGGAMLKGGPSARHADRAIYALGLRPYWTAMSGDQRDALRRDLADRHAGSGPPGGPLMRKHLQDLADKLEAEPFVAEEFAAVLAAQSARLEENFALGQALLVARISEMDLTARKAFAAELRKPGHGGRFKRRN